MHSSCSYRKMSESQFNCSLILVLTFLIRRIQWRRYFYIGPFSKLDSFQAKYLIVLSSKTESLLRQHSVTSVSTSVATSRAATDRESPVPVSRGVLAGVKLPPAISDAKINCQKCVHLGPLISLWNNERKRGVSLLVRGQKSHEEPWKPVTVNPLLAARATC